jgi:hypothetical protein
MTVKVGDKFHYDDSALYPNHPDVFEGEVVELLTAASMRVRVLVSHVRGYYGHHTDITLHHNSQHITWFAEKYAAPVEPSRELPNGFDFDAHRDFMRNL